MELQEAAKLFMEIVEKSPELNGNHFLIMTEEAPAPVSTGYEVVIRTDNKKPDAKTKQTLSDIAVTHRLQYLESKSTISLYTPIEKEKKAIV